MEKVQISEIFCSVQGEGPYIGMRQSFLRFVGCNLNCDYCDTPNNALICNFEKVPGTNEFEELKNPLSLDTIVEKLNSFENVHSISLTGGEPLIFANFIQSLSKNINEKLYLESNMSMPLMAKKIKNTISFVSGDFKQRCEFKKDEEFESYKKQAKKCFKILKNTEKRDCFCKIVITKETNYLETYEIIQDISKYISCVILQPATNDEYKPSVKALINLQNKLVSDFDTRIIPQTHKLWGCL